MCGSMRSHIIFHDAMGYLRGKRDRKGKRGNLAAPVAMENLITTSAEKKWDNAGLN